LVIVAAGEDVEGASGAEFDQRSYCPIAEEPAGKASAAELARLINGVEDEAMALIEERGRTIEIGIITILWS
jgi:hypothetical protein